MTSQTRRRLARQRKCLKPERATRLMTLLLLLLLWQQAGAQLAPPEQFFNSGAQFYISNNIPAALERVEMGLKTYPHDEKLKKLEQLLKQQQQQNQQQNQPDQNQQDQKDQDQQQKDQDKKSDQQNQNDQKKTDEQKPQEQKKDSSDQPKDEKQEQQQVQPVKPGEMTPEEANHLLDAQKGNEQLLQLAPHDKSRTQDRAVRDW
jgi:Ca-activated chloride channel family protein